MTTFSRGIRASQPASFSISWPTIKKKQATHLLFDHLLMCGCRGLTCWLSWSLLRFFSRYSYHCKGPSSSMPVIEIFSLGIRVLIAFVSIASTALNYRHIARIEKTISYIVLGASFSKRVLLPFIWKRDFIHMQIKLILITMFVYQASLWYRGWSKTEMD